MCRWMATHSVNGRPWSRADPGPGLLAGGAVHGASTRSSAPTSTSLAHASTPRDCIRKWSTRQRSTGRQAGYLPGRVPGRGCDPGLGNARELSAEWWSCPARHQPSLSLYLDTSNERTCFSTDAAQREFLRELVSLTHQADRHGGVSASGWSTSPRPTCGFQSTIRYGVLRERYSGVRPEGRQQALGRMADGEPKRPPVVAARLGASGGITSAPRAREAGVRRQAGVYGAVLDRIARHGGVLECAPCLASCTRSCGRGSGSERAKTVRPPFELIRRHSRVQTPEVTSRIDDCR